MAKSNPKKVSKAPAKQPLSKKAPSKQGQSSKSSKGPTSRKATTTGKKRKQHVSSDSEDSAEDTPQTCKDSKRSKTAHFEVVSEIEIQDDISEEEEVRADGDEHNNDKASSTYMKH
jgi:hypothetical protein